MNFKNYHFHLYYPTEQIEKAQSIISKLNQEFPGIPTGRVWDKPVGPHPIGSCQVTVTNEQFYQMTEWFFTHRGGFSLFIHAVTGDDLKDHTDYVLWMGKEYELKTEIFGA